MFVSISFFFYQSVLQMKLWNLYVFLVVRCGVKTKKLCLTWIVFERTKESTKLKHDVIQATKGVTGVSESTVKRIISEGKQSQAQRSLILSTPNGKKTDHKKKL